jgi:hypothetical protein
MSSTEQTRLEKKFIKYHQKNPEVWREFKRYAFEAIEAGRTSYSARFIIHKIRWDSNIQAKSPRSFKISDHASPYYARLFHATFPAYTGLFQILTPDSNLQTVRNSVHQVEMSL